MNEQAANGVRRSGVANRCRFVSCCCVLAVVRKCKVAVLQVLC